MRRITISNTGEGTVVLKRPYRGGSTAVAILSGGESFTLEGEDIGVHTEDIDTDVYVNVKVAGAQGSWLYRDVNGVLAKGDIVKVPFGPGNKWFIGLVSETDVPLTINKSRVKDVAEYATPEELGRAMDPA